MKLEMKWFAATAKRHVAMQAAVALVALAGTIPVVPAAGLVDPTRPAYSIVSGAVTAAKPSGPELQSTFISASQRRAVISGKTYMVGDKFGNGSITDIQAYEVVLKKGDRETRLRLLPKLAKETNMVKVPIDSQEGGKQ